MRGSPQTDGVDGAPVGIIPAHAGLTSSGCTAYRASRDHPRACGAHVPASGFCARRAGSSPRMRGSLKVVARRVLRPGIIPAHAGLTSRSPTRRQDSRDHPRACGAHSATRALAAAVSGSSPRMRGSLAGFHRSRMYTGIIPAHAGLTSRHQVVCPAHWDHPRACGAHTSTLFGRAYMPGSSPRMRGSHPDHHAGAWHLGIIPAHAGLTNHGTGIHEQPRDHPRACGAHTPFLALRLETQGSSPRMRGSPLPVPEISDHAGIIPAHAGLTAVVNLYRMPYWDHPRACGAHGKPNFAVFATSGSSPRMRGSLAAVNADLGKAGIIPAHAGLTPPCSCPAARSGDHPRACGAHVNAFPAGSRQRGSSPRMRGSH